jgi:hypothetical protein
MHVLNPSQSYTFSKLFELKVEPDDLVTECGYTLERTRLNLPLYPGELDRLEELRSRIEEVLPTEFGDLEIPALMQYRFRSA